MMLPSLIFLSGKKRSGKDTFASQLISRYGYQRVAFADELKDEASARWGIPRSQFDRDDLKEGKPFGFAYTRRQLLQMHGRDRRYINPDYWTHMARQKINAGLEKGNRIVVTDARFMNELDTQGDEFPSLLGQKEAIMKIRIERPTLQSDDTDISETALDDCSFDLTITNMEQHPDWMINHFETQVMGQ